MDWVGNIAGFFLNMVLSWLQNQMLLMTRFLIDFINLLTLSFWDNTYVKLMLDFGSWIAFGVFAVSLIVALIDVAEERATGQHIDWGIVFSSIVKAFCFINFARWIAVWSLQLISTLTNYLGVRLDAARMEDGLNNMFTGMNIDVALNTLVAMILSIITTIAAITFVFASFKRFGTMFLHIMQAPLYVPDIMRGDTTKMGEWLRQMTAIVVTYGFQYMFFYLGSTLVMNGDVLIAIPLWLVSGQIPKILNRFGWSTGSTGKFSQFAQAGASLIMMR